MISDIFVDPEEKLIMLYVIQKTQTGLTDFTRKLRAIHYKRTWAAQTHNN